MTSRELPMFPLGMVVFPHQQLGLYVFEARYQQMLADLGAERRFGTCLIARGSEVGGGDERLSIGTVVEVLAAQPFDDGRTLILIEGVHCCEVTTWLEDAPYPRAMVRERLCVDCGIDPVLLKSTESTVRALRALQSEVNADECIQSNCSMDADPRVRSWQLCSMTPMSMLDQFKVLSLSDPSDRLRLLAEICCERYGDYQRMLAIDASHPSLN
ncbi:MAG: LON peptidase substrate-binding domain-containing protein [Acidimicrobiales bacterium]